MLLFGNENVDINGLPIRGCSTKKSNPSNIDSHKRTIKAPAAMRNKPPGPIEAPY